MSCLVCLALEGFPVLSVWPWRDVLSCLSGPGRLSCPVCLALEGFPVCLALEGFPVLSVWPWRAFLSCLSGPGGLSCRVLYCPVCLALEGSWYPPHFPMDIFWGGSRVPAVGAGPRGSRPRAPKTICHGLQSSQLRHGPQSSQLRHGPQSSQLRHGPCLSVLLWRSPSCVPVCVCPEGPPERPPPLPDGTVKARDEPFGRGELCQSSVVCHVSRPHVSLFGLFPVLV